MKNRISKRIVIAWDGSQKMIQSVMKHAGDTLNQSDVIFAIHAMPHESIYTYGSGVTTIEDQSLPIEVQKLSTAFEQAAKKYSCFDRVTLTYLFGDRIDEVCRFAKRAAADLLLVARFEQSAFSKWIHGDLNQRVISKAPCPVMFVADSNAVWQACHK